MNITRYDLRANESIVNILYNLPVHPKRVEFNFSLPQEVRKTIDGVVTGKAILKCKPDGSITTEHTLDLEDFVSKQNEINDIIKNGISKIERIELVSYYGRITSKNGFNGTIRKIEDVLKSDYTIDSGRLYLTDLSEYRKMDITLRYAPNGSVRGPAIILDEDKRLVDIGHDSVRITAAELEAVKLFLASDERSKDPTTSPKKRSR